MHINKSWWLHIVPFFMNKTDGEYRLSHSLWTHITADDSRLSHCLWTYTYITAGDSILLHSLWILHGSSKIRAFFAALVTVIITANKRDRLCYSWQIRLTLFSGWHAAIHKCNFSSVSWLKWLATYAGERVGSHSHQCGICGGQTRTETLFCLSTSILLCQYCSTKAPWIYFINLTLTVYKINNWEHH